MKKILEQFRAFLNTKYGKYIAGGALGVLGVLVAMGIVSTDDVIDNLVDDQIVEEISEQVGDVVVEQVEDVIAPVVDVITDLITD